MNHESIINGVRHRRSQYESMCDLSTLCLPEKIYLD